MNGITIQELLINRGLLKLEPSHYAGSILNKKTKIKLVRQKDQRVDLYSLYCNNYKKFLEYQSEQPKDVFNDVDYIVSFIGEEGLKSRFIGVYKIKGKTKKVITRKEESFWYDMEEVAGFEDLKEKVIVNWMNPISWHQWNTIDKETIVVEIHPGLHYQQFTDYLNVLLNFKELEEIVIKQYIDWKRMLSATKGIYLISDISTGKLYVGSAYGEEGIWGRWAEYVKTNGHGGNKTLKELISNDPKHAQNFQFSILMILPRTITADEAIKKEILFKRKLGKNACELNNN